MLPSIWTNTHDSFYFIFYGWFFIGAPITDLNALLTLHFSWMTMNEWIFYYISALMFIITFLCIKWNGSEDAVCVQFYLTAIKVLFRLCSVTVPPLSASSVLAPVPPPPPLPGALWPDWSPLDWDCRCLLDRLALACRQRWCREKVCWRSSSNRSNVAVS